MAATKFVKGIHKLYAARLQYIEGFVDTSHQIVVSKKGNNPYDKPPYRSNKSLIYPPGEE